MKLKKGLDKIYSPDININSAKKLINYCKYF